MYSAEGKFFYEILDDYKNNENKDEIFDEFCKLIWSSKNERCVFTNYIVFNVDDCKDENYKSMFDKYRKVPYIDYKRTCGELDFSSLLRQKINNIYSLYCDKRIYLKKHYMDLIKYPKNTYFQFLKNSNNVSMLKLEEFDLKLSNAITQSNLIKDKYVKGKVLIGWNKYVLLMNSFMRKCFDNYIPLSQSENKNEFVFDIDLWTEDNYCIKYFCKSLERYFKNYEKEYFGVRQKKKYKNCFRCGGLIETDDEKDICKLCKGYQKVGVKYLICCDCGNEFEVDARNMTKDRCCICQKTKNNERYKRYNKKRVK